MNSSSPISLSYIESKLMKFFFENAEKELYEKEVRKKAGVSAGAANKYLKVLGQKGLLLQEKKGRMNFYRLNREDILVKQIKKAHTLSLPFISKIKEVFVDGKIEISLYGSAARGEDTEKSDIDLLVIGNIEPVELEKNFPW